VSSAAGGPSSTGKDGAKKQAQDGGGERRPPTRKKSEKSDETQKEAGAANAKKQQGSRTQKKRNGVVPEGVKEGPDVKEPVQTPRATGTRKVKKHRAGKRKRDGKNSAQVSQTSKGDNTGERGKEDVKQATWLEVSESWPPPEKKSGVSQVKRIACWARGGGAVCPGIKSQKVRTKRRTRRKEI